MEQQEKKVLNPKESKTEKKAKWQEKQLARWYILNPNGSEIAVSVNGVRFSNKRHFQIMIQPSYIQEETKCKDTERWKVKGCRKIYKH